MKMNITSSQFESYVLNNGIDFDVRWQGEYHGRFFHKGFAVYCECPSDVEDMVKQMKERHGWDLGWWDHSDNLGMGFVCSWNVSSFADDKEAADE